MTYPPQPGQPHDPNQPPYDPNQPPPGGYGPPPQPSPPTGQFQQPPHAPNGQPSYGQFQQVPGQPQSFQDKIKAMPPKQLGIIAGAGAGGLLLLIILLVVVTAGSSPSSVADDYLSAVADADIDEVAEYMCDPEDAKAMGELIGEAEFEKAVEDMNWEILDEDIDGDKAKVEVRITGSKEMAGDETLELEERDGDWFVCDQTSSSESDYY